MPAVKLPKQTPFQRLLAAQAELGAKVAKTLKSPAFPKSKYIPLPTLMEIVHPVMQKHGLVLTQGGCLVVDGYVGVATRIIDAESGDLLCESLMQIPCQPGNPQKGIGAVTYGRRTGITCVLAIAEADDDGNACSKPDAGSRPSAGAKGGGDRKDLW